MSKNTSVDTHTAIVMLPLVLVDGRWMYDESALGNVSLGGVRRCRANDCEDVHPGLPDVPQLTEILRNVQKDGN